MSLSRVRFTVRRMIGAAVITAVGLGMIWMAAKKLEAIQANAEQRECENRLRIIAMALRSEVSACGTFPRGTVVYPELSPENRLSWMTSMLQHYGLSERKPVFDPTRSWDSATNQRPKWRNWDALNDEEPGEATRQVLPVMTSFLCPSHREGGGNLVIQPSFTSYVGIAGLGADAPALPIGHLHCGVFGYDRATKPSDITDGLATTIAVIETTRANGPWMAGGPPTVRGVDPLHRPYIGQGCQFGGLHRGEASALFADGSVRPLSVTIAPRVFEALSTIAGGETLPAVWDQ